MRPFTRRNFLQAALAAGGAASLSPSWAWSQERKLAAGVETKLEVLITGEERIAQPDIWVLEVYLKPVRMIAVTLPNPKTGMTEKRLIWYLCYRALNRPVDSRAADETKPVSDIPGKPEIKRPIFVPECTLVTKDTTKQQSYVDRVMPLAHAAIVKRERLPYQDAVEIVGEIPPPTPYGSKVEKSIYGVATWRGVNPETDRFQVFMTGFSNGYQVAQDAEGNDVVLRKTIVQEFWRPSDQFDEDEIEIRPDSPPKWIYR